MAVVVTNLTASNTQTGATSVATASITPTANNLILASTMSRTAISTAPNQPTLTGCGLTWVAIASVNYDIQGASRKRLTLFRAMGASPSTGALTFDFGGQSQTEFAWAVDQASVIDTTGTNGSGAVVQSATNLSDQGGGGSFTVTLGAFSSVNNATYGVLTDDVAGSATVGSGFSQLSQTTTAQCFLTEWRADNATAVSATLPTASLANSGGIAIEIKIEPIPNKAIQVNQAVKRGSLY